MFSFISSIATANPSHKYTQNELVQFMAGAHGAINGSEVKLKALYRATGIKHRYSVLSDYGKDVRDFDFYPQNEQLEPFPDTASRMTLYKREALSLSMEAAERCLDARPELRRSDISHLITVSCTGFYEQQSTIWVVMRQ